MASRASVHYKLGELLRSHHHRFRRRRSQVARPCPTLILHAARIYFVHPRTFGTHGDKRRASTLGCERIYRTRIRLLVWIAADNIHRVVRTRCVQSLS
jgi:hypothetical protein